MGTENLTSGSQRDRSRLVTYLMAIVVLVSPSFYMYRVSEGIGMYFVRSLSWEYRLILDSEYRPWFSPSPYLWVEPIIILILPTLYLVRMTTMHYRREVTAESLVFWAIISALSPWAYFLFPGLLSFDPDFIIFFPIPSIAALFLIKFKTPDVDIWSNQ